MVVVDNNQINWVFHAYLVIFKLYCKYFAGSNKEF